MAHGKSLERPLSGTAAVGGRAATIASHARVRQEGHQSEEVTTMSANDPGFIAALEEAKKGFAEGGVPIGACLVAADGRILGRGHNMRVQKSSATLHASRA